MEGIGDPTTHTINHSAYPQKQLKTNARELNPTEVKSFLSGRPFVVDENRILKESGLVFIDASNPFEEMVGSMGFELFIMTSFKKWI